MTAREVGRILSQYGFVVVSQKGSHKKWRNPVTRRQAIVPDHAGRIIPMATLRNIWESAQIPEDEWKD